MIGIGNPAINEYILTEKVFQIVWKKYGDSKYLLKYSNPTQ
jgi:hypothetical protein